jgi:hypothetical protein
VNDIVSMFLNISKISLIFTLKNKVKLSDVELKKLILPSAVGSKQVL